MKKPLAQRDELEKNWRAELDEHIVTVDEDDIAKVVSSITGVPVSSLTGNRSFAPAAHGRYPAQARYCQEEAGKGCQGNQGVPAVRSRSSTSRRFVHLLGGHRALARRSLQNRWRSSFVARIRSYPLICLNMLSAIPWLLSWARLQDVGYDEGGELTKSGALSQNSFSFLTIEKAHPWMCSIPLQILTRVARWSRSP